MSQFTKTPPTEPGWYWFKFYDDPSVFEVMEDKSGLFIRYPEVSGPDMDYIYVLKAEEYRNGRANILFGPRVPSPEDIALLTWIRDRVNAAVNVVGSRDEMDTILTEIQGKL